MQNFKFLFIIFSLLLFSCKDKAENSSEKEILTFDVIGQAEAAAINSDASTVLVYVDSTVALNAVTPTITVSANATIAPASGVATDFSNGPVIYTVTAQDNSTKPWQVTVETQKSDEANILTFYHKRQFTPAVITDSTVSLEVKVGTSLTALAPEITVSPKATIEPASGVKVDFSQGPVTYTVTAESGVTKAYRVTVTLEKVYTAAILSYTIPGQVGESVFNNNIINIEVPVGYNMTNVVPTITITEGATIDPASGVAVNFAEKGYVDYFLTNEIGGRTQWQVYVSEEVIKPNNSKIKYMGRFDWSNPLVPRMYAPGATIFTKFRGTFCQIVIEDQNLYGSYHNYLELIVDGNSMRIQTTGKKSTIDVVKDLPDGEHTLTICKATEAGIGYIDFIGLRTTEILEADPLPTRRIELIGNSITCGFGNDVSLIACKAKEWYENNNAYIAYGPVAARALNAQWMLSSESGIGLIHSCCDKTNTMPDIYESVSLNKGGKPWDFSQYQADLVTVCLGQNDGIQDSTVFCTAYVDFVKTIRSKYANANIVLLTSPMADDNLFAAQQKYLTGVVNHMNTEGDSKVYKLYLPKGMINGCDTHPDKAQHEEVAQVLITFIKDNFGW